MKVILSICLLLLAINSVSADEVQLKYDSLTLNANLVKADGNWPAGPVMLMTHGTLAHGNMEIMSGLQAMFKERGISSLSITLSLGVDNRHGMYDCKQPHRHLHTDAVTEIGLWHDWLKKKGSDKIVLLGHSRGGNQTALYAAKTVDKTISSVYLVAPSVLTQDYHVNDYQNRYKSDLEPLLKQAHTMVSNGEGKKMMSGIGFIYCPDTQATAEAFISYNQLAPENDTANLISSIPYPLTIFAGSEDKVVTSLISKAESKVDDKQSKLIIIDGADHFFRDLYSEDIADTIVEELGI